MSEQKGTKDKLIKLSASCIDFTTRSPAKLGRSHMENTASQPYYTLKFTTYNSANLEIEIKQLGGTSSIGLSIPYDLTIDIDPPCELATIDISKGSGDLTLDVSDSKGNASPTITAPQTASNLSLNAIGDTDTKLLKFNCNNEVIIGKICCFGS